MERPSIEDHTRPFAIIEVAVATERRTRKSGVLAQVPGASGKRRILKIQASSDSAQEVPPTGCKPRADFSGYRQQYV
jgi:hypothetical protein